MEFSIKPHDVHKKSFSYAVDTIFLVSYVNRGLHFHQMHLKLKQMGFKVTCYE